MKLIAPIQAILALASTLFIVGCATPPPDQVPNRLPEAAAIKTVTDADIKAEYERLYALADKKLQYRVRHILSVSRDGALRALDRLRVGEDFAAIARQVSADKQNRQLGGELGWSWPDYFEKEFSDTMIGLAPKGLSQTPVKTTAGWHVIEVTDTRLVTPFPSLDEVKTIIAERLRKRAQPN